MFQKRKTTTLKNVFGKEVEFTKWLADLEGKEYLENSLGISISDIKIEVRKPNSYIADMVITSTDPYDSKNETKIIVENQFGKSNHDHLSKLITYAVENGAKYAVWIVEDLHQSHKAAIDFLNDNTNENIYFYVFKGVVEEISCNCIENGKANVCRVFSLVELCAPNIEKKIQFSVSSPQFSTLKLAQLKLWENFASYIKQNNYNYSVRKPQPIHWYNIAIGTTKAQISVCALGSENKLRIDFWINNDDLLFDKLEKQKAQIEKDVGLPLIWDKKTGANASSISYVVRDNFDIYDESKHDECFKDVLDIISKNIIKITKYI